MHRSRIAVVLIDHPEESYDAAAGFWADVRGAVRGRRVRPPTNLTSPSTRCPAGYSWSSSAPAPAPRRGCTWTSRPTTSAAEVARLTGLGATVAEQREGYTVLHDPGGLVFCVVPVQTARADFDEHAKAWD